MKSEVHKYTWCFHTVRTVRSLRYSSSLTLRCSFFGHFVTSQWLLEANRSEAVALSLNTLEILRGEHEYFMLWSLSQRFCGFVEYVWMDCQRWVNKYEQTARNIVWMQKINVFRPGARISLLPLWQTIYPTMIIPQRRAITIPVHSSICLIVWCIASMMYEEMASREVYTVGMKDS